MKSPIFIIDNLRTPVGNPFRSFKDLSAADLAAVVLKELAARNSVGTVGQVILGNTVAAGTGQNLARQAVVKAGLPVSLPAYLVNNVCGAGTQAVINGIQAILSADAQLVLAGGVESASQSPLLSYEADHPQKNKSPKKSQEFDGLFCQILGQRMGDICEQTAAEHNITRDTQDQYALESHQKACRAQKEGKFVSEIVSVGSVSADDRPRANVKIENFASLKPVFRPNGTLTSGNSSVPCDGACALLLGSASYVRAKRLKPKARILGYSSIAISPEKTFEAGPIAIQQCLKQTRLKLKDIDLFEVSEAFAAQAIFTRNTLKVSESKMNIWGGDIALGHPLGAVGARILVTLVSALRDQKKKRGIACVCYGGGGAIAMAVEIL